MWGHRGHMGHREHAGWGSQGSARAGQRGQRGLGAVHPMAPHCVPTQRWLLWWEVTKLISLLRLSSFLRLFLDTAI